MRRGITLLETLVSIAVIALLAAVAFPVVQPGEEAARRKACLTNLRQFRAALQLYASDHEGGATVPGFSDYVIPLNLNTFMRDYLNPKMLICPSAEGKLKRSVRSTYEWRISAFAHTEGDPYMRRSIEQELRRKGGTYPLVICGVHDYLFVAPEEKHLPRDKVRPFRLELRADGSLFEGRTRDPRVSVPFFR